MDGHKRPLRGGRNQHILLTVGISQPVPELRHSPGGRAQSARARGRISCLLLLPVMFLASPGALGQYHTDTILDFDGTWLNRFSVTDGDVYDVQCYWDTVWQFGEEWPVEICAGKETVEVRVDTWLFAPGGVPAGYVSDVGSTYAGVGYLIDPGSGYGIWTAIADHSARERWFQSTCFAPQVTPPFGMPQCQQFSMVFDEDLGTTHDEVQVDPPPPPPPCESTSVIDGVAFSELSGWLPQPEPFERGARIFCQFGQVAVDSRYSSFQPPIGPWWGNPTNDPCRVFLNHVDALAAIHSHPYFWNAADYNAGIACNGQPEPNISQVQLNILNFHVNTDFSSADHDWVAQYGIPLYMRNPLFGHTPLGEILRLDPGQSNPVLVWP